MSRRRRAAGFCAWFAALALAGPAKAPAAAAGPPGEFTLNDVVISIGRGTPGYARRIGDRKFERTQVTICGADGSVDKLLITTQRDTVRQAVQHLTDEELAALLNEFYRIRFFDFPDSFTGSSGVRLVPGTRRLVASTGASGSVLPSEITVRIRDYGKQVSLEGAYAPPELTDLARRLWAYGGER